MKWKVVTGFVPLANRDHRAYHGHGGRLLNLGHLRFFDEHDISNTWLWRFLLGLPRVTHSVADNPDKNTLNYMCVQHQKTEWLLRAAMEDTDCDVFVWIDYGIFHLRGLTEQHVVQFLDRIDEPGLFIPGCWQRGPVVDTDPCWRFCGGVVVCSRSHVYTFDYATKREAKRHIRETGNVSWEVNTWARAELLGSINPTWYQADHNETMFTNFGKPECLESA